MDMNILMDHGFSSREPCSSAPGVPLRPSRGRDYAGTELLRTHRLVLRELRLSDVNDLSALHQEPKVREMLLEPVPVAFLEIAGLVISANRTYVEKPGRGIWHAADHAGEFVGLFSLMPVADSDEVELGARLIAPTNQTAR